MNGRAYQISGLPVGTYQREVDWLNEDSKREDNKIFEDLIKANIEGFGYFIEMERTRRRGGEEN